MITVAKLLERTRLFVNDTNKTKYSDYEISSAIENSVSLLCSALIKFASPEIVRRVELDIVDGKADLPTGFLSIVNVEDTLGQQMFSNYEYSDLPDGCYRVEGDSILSSEDKVYLVYTKTPYGTTQIDLPEFFAPYISGASANLLRGESEAAANKLQEAVYISNMNKRGIIPDPVMWGG
jgi:hypothetical protein